MGYCRTHKTGNLEIIDNGTKPTFANLKLSRNKDIFNIIEEALGGGKEINKKTKNYLVKINEENHAVQIWVSISGFAIPVILVTSNFSKYFECNIPSGLGSKDPTHPPL